MSRKSRREAEDEDSEVGDRHRHRRNEENVEKELINELSSNSNIPINKKGKDVGSIQLDNLYASYLPSSDYYERSYMHRDVLTHLIVTSTDSLITASQDGHIKFWKIITPDYIKQQQTAAQYISYKANDDKEENTNSLINGPVEFVKHFRAHLGPIISLCVNSSGTSLCSSCGDRTLKMFDVLSFDMITMVKFEFVPLICSFVHSSRQALSTLAISDSRSSSIYLYDGRTLNIKEPIKMISKIGHASPVSIISCSPKYNLAISCDQSSIINYCCPNNIDQLPSEIEFKSKLDTDLFDLVKKKMNSINIRI